MREIEPGVFVAGQIAAAAMPALATTGVRSIVNNRPDREEYGQPGAEELGAAARAAGLDYAYIPIAGGFAADDIAAARDALAHGPTLMFCKSGMRSAALWALVRVGDGAAPDAVIRAAAAAGQDLRMLRSMLQAAAGVSQPDA